MAFLATCSDEDLTSLESLLDDMRPSLDYSDIASNAKGVDTHTVERVIDTVVSMYLVGREDIPRFIGDLIESAKHDLESNLEGKVPQWERLEHFLNISLANDKVGFIAGTLDVMTQQGRVYQSARTLTDIRPVFGSAPEQPPLGSVIVHTVQLTYLEDLETKRFHIALDESDLRSLAAVLERALLKEQSVKSYLHKAEIPCIPPAR